MHWQHVASQQVRRLTRRYAFLRRITLTTTLLTLVWTYTLYWGERTLYTDAIEACRWESWEEWPREAVPHHLVFIADPQLVDPHTYPGRPWPLSTMTERYTDLYMARNFRLINARLDPDSIVFLGDLFDGGREWAPDKARALKTSQRKKLEEMGIIAGSTNEKRSLESYRAALSKPHANLISKEDHNIGPNGEDLRAFSPGENGRWSKWGMRQWLDDFRRFGKVFFEPDQLYPVSDRRIFPAFDVPTDPISVENGAKDITWKEYATAGGKRRQLITSLPGNHDVGLGAGVQLIIRDRFQSHFGEGNRIDVLGNHTFVSIDGLSLSAHSQYLSSGYESTENEFKNLQHIWKAPMDFIENLQAPVSKLVNETLAEYWPELRHPHGLNHAVIEAPGHTGHIPEKEWTQHSRQTSPPQLPVILLSHIPLFRPPDTDCGRLRERGRSISVSMGYQYQNVLTQTLSKEIVTKVSSAGEIVAMFSGDDHDYCDVTHRYNIGAWDPAMPLEAVESAKAKLRHIREITVKSFSWAMGVRKPGFLLASLWNPVDAWGETVGTPLPTIQTHLCLLPDQLGIFIDYALLFAFTLPVLILRAIVLILRGKDNPSEADDSLLTPTKLTLPRFQSKLNGTANGYTPKSALKGRQRGSSTSTSSHQNSNGYLGVQRSHTARTRSVSPSGPAGFDTSPAPLIDKAGYFPKVRWTDPADDDEEDHESDEESHVGAVDDSQAKWKWRRRTRGPVRRACEEFGASLLVVGTPVMVWYFFLIKNG